MYWLYCSLRVDYVDVCYILANYALGLVDSSEERHGFLLLLSRSMLYRVFL
jgi:hypothetical protein